MGTKIAWTNETWNPVVGCTKVSAGCQNCYAEKMAIRQAGMEKARYKKNLDSLPKYYDVVNLATRKWNNRIYCDKSALDKPLHWRSPRKIFVCSMGDLFHPSVPFEYILKVIGITTATPWHTYIFLTKRLDRMYDFFACYPDGWLIREGMKHSSFSSEFFAIDSIKNLLTDKMVSKANDYWKNNYDQSGRGKLDGPVPFPQPNLWLGVTCENQKTADERTPILLQIPAAVRLVSVEPMLEPVNLLNCNGVMAFGGIYGAFVNWVIIGCESGPNRRPCKLEWVQDLVAQCKAAGVAVFVKQLDINGKVIKDIKQFPKDLQIREYPK